MTAAPCVLELRDLRVERGGVEVLAVPSFRLHEREFVTLAGPNGSGKSTLLTAARRSSPTAPRSRAGARWR
jgi:tungstate transport system ATP-binding protein